MASSITSGSSGWIGDGSEGGKLEVSPSADGSTTIAFASATQGTPFNIRLDGSASFAEAEDCYYEVNVTELSKGSSLGVGLATSDGFRPGWKTKGCFYNGNVTNESAGLIIGFGKRIVTGDTVGVYLRRSIVGENDAGGRCEVVFYSNGRCLGAGFSLEEKSERFYPCLHLSGSATVVYSVPSSPSVYRREQEVYADRYSGDWAIEEAFAGPELGQLSIPERATFTIRLENVDGTDDRPMYNLFAKIDNSFRTSFAITGKVDAFDKILFAGPCMSTMKMPRPAYQEMERFIESSLDSDCGWRKMIVTEEGKLILSGPTSEVICSRFVETFEPVDSIK